MRLIRIILWRAIFVISVYGVLCILTGIFLAEGGLHPARREIGRAAVAESEGVLEASGRDLREVSVAARDGAALRAWSIRSKYGEGSAVILLHGLGDNRMGMLGYATLFLRHGYAVLMPDARAHGASGGDLATYGLLERDDIHRWVEWLRAGYRPRCVFALGESMGAAELLQALTAESGFCAIVAESSFSNFREIAYDRMGQRIHAGAWVGRTLLRPVVESAFLYARWRYGLKMSDVSPAVAVISTTVPILLIHGQEDHNISIRHSRCIRERNGNVVLWEVPHADHCGAMSTAPQQFEQIVLGWFRRYAAPDS